MVKGCVLWNDRNEYNIQTNDPVEQLNKKLLIELTAKYPNLHWGYLESCGPNAMTNCLVVTEAGRQAVREACKTLGTYNQQAPHIIIGYLNDPANYHKFIIIRDNLKPESIQGNRVPQYYSLVAKEVFNIKATFEENLSFDKARIIVSERNPLQVCLINPGHYVTLKAYDEEKNIFYGDDSWPERTGKGFNIEFKREDFRNFRNWFIRYWVE